MKNEVIFLSVILTVITVILSILWFTGRKALVYKIMTKIEFLYHSEYGQRKKVEALNLLKVYIATKFSKYKLIQDIILFFLPDSYVNKTIDKLAPKINTFVKPLAQAAAQITAEKTIDKFTENLNLQETTPNNLFGFAETLKIQARDKGFFVAEAGINGNTERKGVDYYAKAGLGIKF